MVLFKVMLDFIHAVKKTETKDNPQYFLFLFHQSFLHYNIFLSLMI